MTREVHLSIDTLVLDGVAPADRVGLERILRERIAQALAGASDADLAGIASRGRVDAGRIANPGEPGALGGRIAAQLIGGGS